jgi:magnesium transporter
MYRRRYLLLLSGTDIAELLQELDSEDQAALIEIVGTEKSTEILNEMSTDDAADLLGQLEEEHSEEILVSMDENEAAKIKALLIYPPDTAGGIMTNEYVWIRRHYTVGEATEKLRAFAHIAESIYYLYVINEDRKLVGVLSIRDLLLHPAETPVQDIMFERVISVPVDMDQEEVARVIERYNFVSVPVVDQDERLVGIITHDDVMDVLIAEHEEDISRLSGFGKESITLQTTAFQSAVRRLPWLVGLLFIGLGSGSILSLFSDTIEKVVALTFFMPMIAGMTGNTGTQSLAVVIRGLASRELSWNEMLHLIRREFGVALLMGIVCGILIGLVAMLWMHNIPLGIVVGGSLFLTLIIGTLAGTLIPLVLHALKVDPAVASGPLITTINDIFSLTVYFGTATLFIRYLV